MPRNATRDHTGPHGITWDHREPHGTMQNHGDYTGPNRTIQTGNGIISPTSGLQIKKLLLQDVSHFSQGV